MRLTAILLLLTGFLVPTQANAEGVGSGKYAVWVYKNEGGQWVKQPERTLNTDDAKVAKDYVAQVNAVEDWTANTNAPDAAVESVVGTWVSDGERTKMAIEGVRLSDRWYKTSCA